MKKKRRDCILFLLCLVLSGAAGAVEIINIDINNYNNDTAYSGAGAFPGRTDWIAFYGGWGVAVGSQRSADLVNQGAEGAPGTYAAQVWIGDDGLGHGYIGSGATLLEDGFVNNNPRASGATVEDPNLAFMGQGAYGGNFDVYVYGYQAGEFMIADGNDVLARMTITGGPAPFVEGVNYVVFENVPLGNPNMIRLYYTNQINGLQLVSRKGPFTVIPSSDPNDNWIDARNYDVARDTNAREGEMNLYGPDLGSYVHYLDTGEYMIYDIFVSPEAQGLYNLSADFVTNWGPAGLNMYLDDALLGTLTQTQSNDNQIYQSLETLPVNLFAGTRQLKWMNTQNYFDVVRLRLTYVGPLTLATCEDVYRYKMQPAGDFNQDCRVDLTDLAGVAADWLRDYNPQPQ